jgi:hypothetical protein
MITALLAWLTPRPTLTPSAPVSRAELARLVEAACERHAARMGGAM